MKNTSCNFGVSLSSKFERFAESECRGNSPMYFTLSKQIANDEDLLKLCAFSREGQPVPNLFLAAVHFFVLKEKGSFLARFYPSVTGKKTEAIPFEVFKAFVQEHDQGIVNLLQTRIVQTNVLTRCNYLLPVFSNLLYQTDKPSTIIDIGSSAGLNLNFDCYQYYYNGNRFFGNSSVKLHCTIKGENITIVKPFVSPVQKIGIDQNLIDLSDEDDLTWLQALIWPDQLDRFSMLTEAIRLPNLSEIDLVKGNTIDDFRNVIESVSSANALILFATHVLYQFSENTRLEFYDLLDRIGQERDFSFVSAESMRTLQLKYGIENTPITLTTYKNKQKVEKLIAETNGHGNWVKWY